MSYDVTITIIHNLTKDELIHPQDFKSKIQSLIKTNGIRIVHLNNVFFFQILWFHKNDNFWLINTFHIEKHFFFKSLKTSLHPKPINVVLSFSPQFEIEKINMWPYTKRLKQHITNKKLYYFQLCNQGTFLNFHKERRCGGSKMKLGRTYKVEPKVKWIYRNHEKKWLM